MSESLKESADEHEPTEEEDNKLFLATGFRYTPAYKRGFPYPWCAKKSTKGWVIVSQKFAVLCIIDGIMYFALTFVYNIHTMMNNNEQYCILIEI